ncbi:MAG: UDP-N-acetylmuramate dehydrogenase [Erysipelotrichaceae bacterium]
MELEKYGAVEYDVSLKTLTTLKVGGTAKAVLYPYSCEDLKKVIDYLKGENIPYYVLGNGSNILASDDYYDGVIIKLGRFINKLEQNDNCFYCEAGASLIAISYKVSGLGYSGLEFASGIPGTIGGGVYMNAGAYKKSMADIIKDVTFLDDNNNFVTLDNKDLEFAYRTSLFQKHNWIILSVNFCLEKDDPNEIMDLICKRKEYRLKTQPLNMPSFGSTFVNPLNNASWSLIDSLGYRGYQIGDAQVSEKHCNFIVNMGQAKADDFYKIITEIKEAVKDKYDIDMEVEPEFFNWK